MSEFILEWFEKHPDQATRSTPLASALGLNHDRVADGLWRLAKQGKLVKCKVTVGDQDRIKGAPIAQWEYKLPAGAFALSEVTPLKPVKAYRREPSSTQAGSGITPAVSASQTIVDGGQHDADSAPMAGTVVEQLPQDDSLAVAGSDVSWTAKKAAELLERAAQAEAELESILNENIEFCGWVSELTIGTQHPLSLFECKNIILEILDNCAARIASLEGNAALPLEITTKQASTAVVKESLTTQTDACEMLRRAACHMLDRAATYDAPGGERSMSGAIKAFNAITAYQLSESDGWLLMQLLKDARQWQRTDYHADSAEDCIAYAALKAEALAREAA